MTARHNQCESAVGADALSAQSKQLSAHRQAQENPEATRSADHQVGVFPARLAAGRRRPGIRGAGLETREEADYNVGAAFIPWIG